MYSATHDAQLHQKIHLIFTPHLLTIRPAYGSGLHYMANAVLGTNSPFPIYVSHTDRGPNQDW